MRILLAFDKFKDALTAPQACSVAAEALRAGHSDWTFDLCPLADGGDGFADILTRAAGGTLESRRVTGPLGKPIEASFGLVAVSRIPKKARALLDLADLRESDSIAVIEMAVASGLASVLKTERSPWKATSRGTGELIFAAHQAGAAGILLGVGGSATHDLGLGALSALGFHFRTTDGSDVSPLFPSDWSRVNAIVGSIPIGLPPIRIACDVSNPLLGPRGAANVYGPQKGLVAADLERIEKETARLSALLSTYCKEPASLAQTAGTGAAGGISFGLMAAAGAKLLPGFDLVSAWVDLEDRLTTADVVLTGEGRFDASSWEGKGPGAVVSRAIQLGKRAYVFAGQLTSEAPGRAPKGVSLQAITPPGTALAQALKEAASNLAKAVRAAL